MKIAFVMNKVAGGWDPSDSKSYGGSEECVVALATELAARRHDVEVFGNFPFDKLAFEGVTYRRDKEWKPDEPRHVVIGVKWPDLFDHHVRCLKKILWTADPHHPGDLTPNRLKAIDLIVPLSNWHLEELLQGHPYLDAKMLRVIEFGILEPFLKNDSEHVPTKILYASSFDRGLEFLLDSWPDIRSEVPEAELHVWYGWTLSDKIAGQAKQYRDWQTAMNQKMARPGIVRHERTTIDDPTPYKDPGVWAYPCNGGERYCITGQKAQAMGAVPVIVPTMALEETVRYGLKSEPTAFVATLIGLLKDPDEQERLRQEMAEGYKARTWAEAAAEWEAVFPEEAEIPEIPEFGLNAPGRPTVPAEVRPDGLDICMVTPGLPHDGDTLGQKDLGGSETASICMANALADLGHHVTVFSAVKSMRMCGKVLYQPIDIVEKVTRTNIYDLMIVQRMPEFLRVPRAAKLCWLWMHDLGLRKQAGLVQAILWQVDAILTVSKWHADQYKKAMGCPDGLIIPTRNGIRLDEFPTPKPLEERERKTLIYAARPERGLGRLLFGILPKLLERDPEIRLKVCAYDNVTEQMKPLYENLKKKCDEYPEAEWIGAVKQSDLWELYATMGAYCYPTPDPGSHFAEVSCISAMEAMACGLPFIGTAHGALPETCNDAAVLVENHEAEDFNERFADAVINVLSNEDIWQEMSEAGRKHAKSLAWGPVAEEWTEEMYRQIGDRNQDAARRAKHFMRRSDIMAASAAIREVDESDPWRADLITTMSRWDSLTVDEILRRQAQKRIPVGAPTPDGAFSRMAQAAANAPGSSLAVIGYRIANLAPVIAKATRKEVEIIDLAANRMPVKGDFDSAILLNALEQVPDPCEFLESVAAIVKPNGGIIAQVPYGPWEHDRIDDEDVHPAQLWELDLHDIRDLLKGFKDLNVVTIAGGIAQRDGCPIGWRILSVVNNGTPGKINMARKQAIQTPRETVSALIIAGDNPNQTPTVDTFRWFLRSLRNVADEVWIGDCGDTMSQESRMIAKQFNRLFHAIHIVPTSDPLKAGFETPRNELLHLARGDWILWVDTDESLIDARNIPKYMRKTALEALPIRQHHFSCDTKFPADVPARMFRRIGIDGRGARWFGFIHEHPEKALNTGPGIILGIGDTDIAHIGYLRESIRKQRFVRNRPLLDMDRARYPDRNLQAIFIMRDNMLLVAYHLKHNGGRITPELGGLCEETVQVWSDRLKGKPSNPSADPLDWLTQALTILGRGIAVRYGMETGMGKIEKAPDIKDWRFPDQASAIEELAGRTERNLKRFDTVYW